MSMACPENVSPSGRLCRLLPILVSSVLALAALLRLGALRAEFWFDEIWSWEFARRAGSPWEVFAGTHHHHDNNHKLNTLFLWLFPDGVGWWWYRLPSFVAGLVSVALAVLIARRRGRVEAVIAALLFATNYWLAVAATEARGYALAVCFALLAFYALEGYFVRGGWRMLVLFWVSVILGFSAHLTFIHCYLALGLWSVYYFARRRLPARAEIRELLICHAVPSLFFVVLYLVDIRRMQIGGAPPLPTTEVLGRLFSLGLGASSSSMWFIPAGVLAAAAFGLGMRLLAGESRHLWLFFSVAVVGSPALFLLGKPAFLFERYFLISFVFFLLLLSYVLAFLWRSSRLGALLAGALVLAIAAGGVEQIRNFERGGRGHFLDALACIERQTPEGVVAVSGDYDFRVRKFYTFFVPYLSSGKQFTYQPQDALPAHGADWLLVHRLDDRHPPEPQMYDSLGNAYQRVRDFPIDSFGGWSWYVYRNEQAISGQRSAVSQKKMPLAASSSVADR
jgi:hypothetical protein